MKHAVVNLNKLHLEGATIATRKASKCGGAMIKPAVCYTQHSILAVLYVACYQSVTRNSNNISGYV